MAFIHVLLLAFSVIASGIEDGTAVSSITFGSSGYPWCMPHCVATFRCRKTYSIYLAILRYLFALYMHHLKKS
jgi:hypothetical protein